MVAGGAFALFGIQGVGRIVLVEELIRRLSDRTSLNLFYRVADSRSNRVK